MESDSTPSRKEITADKIRTTALHLFGQEGYHHTSIRQIASKAGIALGLMYSHYSGKEALLKDLLQTGIHNIQESFRTESVNKPLLEQCLILSSLLKKEQAYWRLIHGVRMQKSLADFVFNELEEMQLHFIEHFRSELKKLKIKNARTEARIIWCCLDGIFAQQQIRDDFPTEKTIAALCSRYV
ncbi:MAG: TetR/AcrR family transcriptional regulator [Bacteroidota bacterium]|nr:TetR/AcrR family transcriptional regulator [Bacteroidota bacterium]MDX5430729.1 TetR/AcrR family transcriptional regulator [Bacteroidota bacterium]MDX5469476.1 TetR/AcrR family transcriptional regulator [Bacteroidota bacterium]